MGLAITFVVSAALCVIDMSYEITGSGEANLGAWGLIGLTLAGLAFGVLAGILTVAIRIDTNRQNRSNRSKGQ